MTQTSAASPTQRGTTHSDIGHPTNSVIWTSFEKQTEAANEEVVFFRRHLTVIRGKGRKQWTLGIQETELSRLLEVAHTSGTAHQLPRQFSEGPLDSGRWSVSWVRDAWIPLFTTAEAKVQGSLGSLPFARYHTAILFRIERFKVPYWTTQLGQGTWLLLELRPA